MIRACSGCQQYPPLSENFGTGPRAFEQYSPSTQSFAAIPNAAVYMLHYAFQNPLRGPLCRQSGGNRCGSRPRENRLSSSESALWFVRPLWQQGSLTRTAADRTAADRTVEDRTVEVRTAEVRTAVVSTAAVVRIMQSAADTSAAALTHVRPYRVRCRIGRRRDRSVVQDRIRAKRLPTGPVHTATRGATIPVTAALATGATLGDLSAGASTGRQVRPLGRKAAATTLATCGLPIPGGQVVSAPIVLPVDNPDFRIQGLPMPSREEII
jgi:hypothetical protein